MRFILAALALAASLALCTPQAFASPPEAPGATPELRPPADATDIPAGSLALPDDDTPPPFVLRRKPPPQPKRPDLTYATRPEPKEFRGLAWGTPLEAAKAKAGLMPVTSPRPLSNTYFRPEEPLKLGQADIRTVAYYFRNNTFQGVGIVFAGEANFFLVKDYLIGLYGQGRQVGDRYGWTWTHVNIDLRLRDGMGELRFTHEP